MKWQDWVDTSSHLEAVGNLAAHVHITTTELLRASYAPTLLLGGSISELISPQTFIDCLKMTKTLAMEIKKKEQVCTLIIEYRYLKKVSVFQSCEASQYVNVYVRVCRK